MTTPATVSHHDLGDLVQLRATYTSTDNVTPADPSYVAFFTNNEQGSVACYVYGLAGASVARAGTGAYFKDVTPDIYGKWHCRSMATGLIQAAEEWIFLVQRSFVL